MVLTQQELLIKSETGYWTFPYHYGSHATRWTSMRELLILLVSIPLWFSRNRTQRELIPMSEICFHTTMVLTQLYPWIPPNTYSCVSIPLWFSRNMCLKRWARSFPTRFHTTMVLTQHVFATLLSNIYSGFHTTMVLTQLMSIDDKYLWRVIVSIPLWFSRNL